MSSIPSPTLPDPHAEVAPFVIDDLKRLQFQPVKLVVGPDMRLVQYAVLELKRGNYALCDVLVGRLKPGEKRLAPALLGQHIQEGFRLDQLHPRACAK